MPHYFVCQQDLYRLSLKILYINGNSDIIYIEGHFMSTLSNNIKYMRLMRGLSQRELAEKLNKSTNAIANWEREVNCPDVDTLETMCKVLNVTPNQIYGWDQCAELIDFLNKRKSYESEINDLIKQRDYLDFQIKEYSRIIGRKQ